jgi:hypothetical protein
MANVKAAADDCTETAAELGEEIQRWLASSLRRGLHRDHEKA